MKIPRRLEDPEWPGHFHVAAFLPLMGAIGAGWGIMMGRVADAIGAPGLVLILITLPIPLTIEWFFFTARFARRREAMRRELYR